jgi:hypothetical protein
LGPFAEMPFEKHLLNSGADDLRRERRALLRASTQLHSPATAASFDFGSLRGRVEKALAFLYADEFDELPRDKLADRWEVIRDMIEDMRPSVERFETENFLRVMGQSGPGSGANQPMGPTTSPTVAVQVASRDKGIHDKTRIWRQEIIARQDQICVQTLELANNRSGSKFIVVDMAESGQR